MINYYDILKYLFLPLQSCKTIGLFLVSNWRDKTIASTDKQTLSKTNREKFSRHLDAPLILARGGGKNEQLNGKISDCI